MEREQPRHGPPPRVSLLCGLYLARTLQGVGRQLARADRDLFGDVFVDGLHRSLDELAATLDPSAEALLLAEVLRSAAPSGLHVLFTLSPLATGWFSHWHPDRRAVVVSVAGWETGLLGPSLEPFLAYEAILHGLRTLGDAWTPEALLHEETRGCLFDARTHKTDVQLRLEAGDLCPSCRKALEGAGAPLRRIERLAAVVRLLAAPAGVVH